VRGVGVRPLLEKDHGLAINDEDLVPEDLDSTGDLVGSFSRKRTRG